MDSRQSWTNQTVLHEFLRSIVRHIYRVASQSVDGIREAAADENPNRLQDRLVELQGAVVDRIFSFIDGTSGPTDWPGIKLVNAETGKSLSDNLAWDLASIEGEFLTNFESSTESDSQSSGNSD